MRRISKMRDHEMNTENCPACAFAITDLIAHATLGDALAKWRLNQQKSIVEGNHLLSGNRSTP
jgi:uncharacterized Zn-binding protein involved in type VI secretion